jgi:hypothetical protein
VYGGGALLEESIRFIRNEQSKVAYESWRKMDMVRRWLE